VKILLAVAMLAVPIQTTEEMVLVPKSEVEGAIQIMRKQREVIDKLIIDVNRLQKATNCA
jgi:hypothetical protein